MTGLQQKIADLAVAPGPAWLNVIRDQGRALWQASPWPTRKTEAWKYTSLKCLEQGDFFSHSGDAVEGWSALPEDKKITDLDATVLVFVNGRFDPRQSQLDDLPEGVQLLNFASASQLQGEQIQAALNSVVDLKQHPFAALNNQLLEDGAFLLVGKGVRVSKPILTVWLSGAQAMPSQSAQRLLLVMEERAEATVIEQFVSATDSAAAVTFGLSELCLADGAQLQHYQLHQESHEAIYIGGVHASLGRSAVLNSFHLALGSTLQRIDVVVNHQGEGGECVLNGIYLPCADQHVDYHTCLEHRVPLCTSNETFRGIISDNGRAVFNGRIHIHPQAQKTLAQLSNRNLLTSDKAEVNTKPELEIYADDVQCAHGATVAQLDETVMHYFRTRGISQSEAEVMLSFGFINELLNKVKLPAIGDYLRPILASRFARDPKLMRHIV